MKNKIIKTDAFMVITDHNMLCTNINESWVVDFTENYLIYDRAHRFQENEKIKHQQNVGYNIYDIFHFITENYEKLPNIIIFCKGNVIPRHCGILKFINIINNTEFTPIENYIREVPTFTERCYAYVDENDGYNECFNEVNNTAWRMGTRYVSTYKELLDEIYENANHGYYIRFAPGANYLLTKKDILRYNKNFYETMRKFVSWSRQPGEAYILERALYTIFKNDFIIKEKYKNDNN